MRSAAVDFGLVLGAMALATLVALAAGAADLGTALGIGQVVFALALLAVVVRR